MTSGTIKAVLGPTNTGKTHLAIERLCAHSSGMMGFPLRLLAREVYDRVVAIKGERSVALITGEERIEPPDARYFLCTAEAMPVDGVTGERPAFVALDEAQLGANPERGHIFTDRLLHARGREETMLLGSASLEPLVRALVPGASIEERPRFSTLTHAGSAKLSRLPPRSAVVAFSAEQVYAVAEMLRRFRGGAAVVMGALSPETRNRQVELFQNGEVDYIVATDAIGMGLNLDVHHVAFAALTKFDGQRKRRLTPSEMAQIAGRAGRHQRDGSFGTLSGMGGAGARPVEFTEEEIYAIEEHRFAPLTHLFWRNPEPRFDTLGTLLADLDLRPPEPELRLAPEAVDLAVLRRLAEEQWAQELRGSGTIRRFWEACSLPDFRQSGADTHARFVARLWADLRHGYLGADYVAARIAELDNVQGDISTLQGRIAAIRSWAYICQRPDWVLARDEMAARARGVEARLSDALHARLTERFVNRRTTLLMKSLGKDAAMLPVTLAEDGAVLVEDEAIGRLEGFRFVVDHQANHADRKMLLAAGEKALPGLLAQRAEALVASGFEGVAIERGALRWSDAGQSHELATIRMADGRSEPVLEPARELAALPEEPRARFMAALGEWLAKRLEPLAPLRKLEEAARNPEAGSQARALLLTLIDGHGFVTRERAGLEHLPKEMRPFLRRLGVTFGALDIFAPALLKPAPRELLHALGIDRRRLQEAMLPVIPGEGKLPAGYRAAGTQFIRIDLAEKILRAAHEARGKTEARRFRLELALPVSIGLEEENARRLLGAGGFRVQRARPLSEGAHGPPAPDSWEWRPSRRGAKRTDARKPRGKQRGKPSGKRPAHGKPRERKPDGHTPATGKAFAGLADLLK